MSEKKKSTSYEKLKRVIYLHQKLRNTNERSGLSGEQLLEYLYGIDEISIDEKTLRDDLKFLRDQLNAPLPKRANKHKGYYYETKDTYSLLEELDGKATSEIIEIVAVVRRYFNNHPNEFAGIEDVLLKLEQGSSLISNESDEYIAFEEVDLQGREHLLPLLQHIRNGNYLTMEYKPYHDSLKNLVVYPLMLKEYNNRWYLIAWEESADYLSKIALDRIKSFKITSHQFIHPPNPNIKQHFDQVVGVTVFEEKTIETVVLRSHSRVRAQYLITKPLHKSQKHIEISGNQYEFRLQVIVNPELTTKILEYGADLEVIEPLHLRKTIRDIASKMLSRYQEG